MKTVHKKPVITPMLEKADSLTDGQLQVNDNSCLREIGQDDRR